MPFVVTPLPTGSQKPARPHLQFPVRRGPDGKLVFVEQDSEAHVMSCANMIARCPSGYREDRPEFGWDWPDLDLIPVDPTPLVNALHAFEERIEDIQPVEDLAAQLAQAALGVQDIDLDLSIRSGDTTGLNAETD